MLTEIGSDIQRLAETIGKACVGVGRHNRVGSGVVLRPGQVVTNAHNVGQRGRTITFTDGRQAPGEPMGIDLAHDLAVLEVDTGEIEPIARAEGDHVSLGSPVVAVANPGGRGLRVTFGFVSGTDRSFRSPRGRLLSRAVEHTAPLLPGSSGGPLVDLDGRLVGLNTHRLGDGFYLAIPADDAMYARMDTLSRGEDPSGVRLGIAVIPPQMARRMRRAVGLADVDGLLVGGVEEGGPAAQAGVRRGDLITRVGDSRIVGIDDLYGALDETQPGDSLELHVIRGTEELSLTIQVGP